MLEEEEKETADETELLPAVPGFIFEAQTCTFTALWAPAYSVAADITLSAEF